MWGVDLQSWELVLGGVRGSRLPDGLPGGQPVTLDYTTDGDTFRLSGVVVRAHYGIQSRLVVAVQHAEVCRQRRFFRVAVDITPMHVSLVTSAAGRQPSVAVTRRDRHERHERHERRDQDEGPTQARIVDLSVGGLGMLTAAPLASGTVVDVHFALPAEQGLVCVRGHVVPPPGPAERLAGSTGCGPSVAADGLHRCGVHFQPLPTHDLDRLLRALHLQERALRSAGTAGAATTESQPPTPGWSGTVGASLALA